VCGVVFLNKCKLIVERSFAGRERIKTYFLDPGTILIIIHIKRSTPQESEGKGCDQL
jgi:hypothetical protein